MMNPVSQSTPVASTALCRLLPPNCPSAKERSKREVRKTAERLLGCEDPRLMWRGETPTCWCTWTPSRCAPRTRSGIDNYLPLIGFVWNNPRTCSGIGNLPSDGFMWNNPWTFSGIDRNLPSDGFMWNNPRTCSGISNNLPSAEFVWNNPGQIKTPCSSAGSQFGTVRRGG